MSDQDGPLWTIHIPGGGIKKVHLPPLPDETSWNFKLPEQAGKEMADFARALVAKQIKAHGENELDWFKLYQPEGEEK